MNTKYGKVTVGHRLNKETRHMKFTKKELHIITDALFRQGTYWGEQKIRNEGHNDTRKKFCANQQVEAVKIFNRIKEQLLHLAK